MYKPKTSDEAVKKATGKVWKEWFTILDKYGAKKLAHIDIAKMVYDKYLGKSNPGISPDVASSGGWWSQMVTVEYERSRGLRKVNQSTSGYSVSVHKTVNMPVSTLFTEWRKIAKRKKLAENTLQENKTIRYKAEKSEPLFVAVFASKGPARSRIAIEAMRLPSAKAVEEERTKWKKEFEKLQ